MITEQTARWVDGFEFVHTWWDDVFQRDAHDLDGVDICKGVVCEQNSDRQWGDKTIYINLRISSINYIPHHRHRESNPLRP